MSRDNDILEVLPLVESFSRQNSRGDPALYEDLKSRLTEVLVRRLSSDNPVLDLQHYFKRTFSAQVQEHFRHINDLATHTRALSQQPQQVTHNNAVYNLLFDEITSSPLLTSEERDLITLRIAGFPDKEICSIFDVSRNRFKAVMFKLREKLKEHL